jgi:hypothetical protein
MTDRQFVTAGEWALASDGFQWVLQADDADRLVAGLPPTFDEWLEGSGSWSGASNAPPLVPTKVPLDQAETITENSGKTA